MAREKDCRHFFGDTEKAIGFSQVVKAGNVLYVSGVLAVDENLQVVGEGDMTAQVAQVYANLGRILSANGASFQDVVKETVFATDLAALAGALAPRKAAFDADGAYVPASTMVQITGLFLPGAMIEVEMIAHLEG
ncbi:RidA family protein [Parvibaculum sp.]|jgi:enamine deaminase RidA (YjgF/YER057c/UK114 family)|uniref:RidA family protein n=1 Tax=Parvibaculum sp. TaxID=2024848 RepID=UPI001B1BC51F|nr:RidA family protein [Parvibaculum sp.]MBO6634328.1 RidA family protein [Parvibaculum sp.]MBO6677581.1 RidA family protein [Parvibaculum sp.]MBO6685910.1 RidA family protein [Parvibaculum sp.]